MRLGSALTLVGIWLVFAGAVIAGGENAPATAATATAPTDYEYDQAGDADRGVLVEGKEKLLGALPPSISEGLDVNVWGWFGELFNTQDENRNYWDVETGLGITKTFNQRVTLSAQGNFIDASRNLRGELEQAYGSALLWERSQTILTVGKFNANFGIEARDFWNRTTGTASLLFGAQPQDLIGFMVTQPIGDTGVTLRPFMSADFQGAYYFDQPPAGGLMVEYQPNPDWDFALTNWVGPGFVQMGGQPLREPYEKPGAGYDEPYASNLVANWQGPNLHALRGGTVYFAEAKATWKPTVDLSLGAEALLSTTDHSSGQSGWYGCMLLANYSLTDRWHAFARYSFLNDSDWFVTGAMQRVHELSGGLGYEIYPGVELRGEYRHDFSNVTGDVDSVSVHLSFGV
jgi:hypothetical protein